MRLETQDFRRNLSGLFTTLLLNILSSTVASMRTTSPHSNIWWSVAACCHRPCFDSQSRCCSGGRANRFAVKFGYKNSPQTEAVFRFDNLFYSHQYGTYQTTETIRVCYWIIVLTGNKRKVGMALKMFKGERGRIGTYQTLVANFKDIVLAV